MIEGFAVAEELEHHTLAELLVADVVADAEPGPLGVFVDDAKVTADGTTLDSTSFEDGLGGWSVPGAPEGSRPLDCGNPTPTTPMSAERPLRIRVRHDANPHQNCCQLGVINAV